jgi:hypothetical protein
MKKTVLLLAGLLAAFLYGHSQSLSLGDDRGGLHNGEVVYITGSSDTLQLITWLHIKNIAANTIRVRMKKQEISMIPGTNCSICWAGYCYGPEMVVSTFPLTMAPAQSDTGCFTHYGPSGKRGTSIVRWTFYNEANPGDSISITVHYITYPAAVGETSDPGARLGIAGPLPANENLILRHDIPSGKSGRIGLFSLSGAMVSESLPVAGQGTAVIKTAGLPSGTYITRILLDGQPVISRKVAVSH